MNKKYFQINNNGEIIGSFDSNPNLDASIVMRTTPPPDLMLKPCWISKQWIESATNSELSQHIDAETSNAIKQWCINKGKNEEWFINCGIKIAIASISDTSNEYYILYHQYTSF